jgi:hypothetical protein
MTPAKQPPSPLILAEKARVSRRRDGDSQEGCICYDSAAVCEQETEDRGVLSLTTSPSQGLIEQPWVFTAWELGRSLT